MTKRKYKMTGCARFFFILIIVIPLAYMAASYINGQDGWENLKKLFSLELPGNFSPESSTTPSDEVVEQPPVSQDDEISIDELRDQNRALLEALQAARDSIKILSQTERDSI